MVLVSLILVAHFGFLAYVLFGGFLAWRWPRAFWPHLVAAGWGLAVITLPLICPLTLAENWARRRAGEHPSAAGFIDRYIEGVLYPVRYTHLLQVGVGVLVIGSWLVAWVLLRRRRPADTEGKSEVSSDPTVTV
jgi:hypothetical protein